ncbi:hypothetical protein RA307_23370 [Xanthobacteraceae bacterium Astr-EGSB]|uniref:hypothetical protein n=1 Tax=Astrobacterium formosum TaxID=3069710 RepID=UPI0027B74B02|nr:hypothetical protein [Xanthobacteraceae bacterium Astr-EGSB]
MIDNFKGLAAEIASALGAEGSTSVWDIVVVAVVFLGALAFLVRLHGGGRKRRDAPACSCCAGGCASRAPVHGCSGVNEKRTKLPLHGARPPA